MAKKAVAPSQMAVWYWLQGRVLSFELHVFYNNRALVTFCSGRSGRRSFQRQMKETGQVHNQKDLERIPARVPSFTDASCCSVNHT